MPFCFVLFWDRVLVACLGWPWTHSNSPALASQVLGFQTGTTMPNFGCPFIWLCKASKTFISTERYSQVTTREDRRWWAKITGKHIPLLFRGHGCQNCSENSSCIFPVRRGAAWLCAGPTGSENPGHTVTSSTTLTWIFSQTYSEE